MWTQGTFRFHDCEGHDRQVGEVGDGAQFCQVFLGEEREGMFRIVWDTLQCTDVDLVVEFTIGRPLFFAIFFSDAVAEPLEDGWNGVK